MSHHLYLSNFLSVQGVHMVSKNAQMEQAVGEACLHPS